MSRPTSRGAVCMCVYACVSTPGLNVAYAKSLLCTNNLAHTTAFKLKNVHAPHATCHQRFEPQKRTPLWPEGARIILAIWLSLSLSRSLLVNCSPRHVSCLPPAWLVGIVVNELWPWINAYACGQWAVALRHPVHTGVGLIIHMHEYAMRFWTAKFDCQLS